MLVFFFLCWSEEGCHLERGHRKGVLWQLSYYSCCKYFCLNCRCLCALWLWLTSPRPGGTTTVGLICFLMYSKCSLLFSQNLKPLITLVKSFLLQILLFKLQVSLCPRSSQLSFVNKICAHSPLLCEIALQTKKRQLKRCFCGRCDICLHPGRKIVTSAKEHSHTYYHICCSFNY